MSGVNAHRLKGGAGCKPYALPSTRFQKRQICMRIMASRQNRPIALRIHRNVWLCCTALSSRLCVCQKYAVFVAFISEYSQMKDLISNEFIISFVRLFIRYFYFVIHVIQCNSIKSSQPCNSLNHVANFAFIHSCSQSRFQLALAFVGLFHCIRRWPHAYCSFPSPSNVHWS